MSESKIRCPECSRFCAQAVPPDARVRCPECGHVFRAGGEPPAYRGVTNTGVPEAAAVSREAFLNAASRHQRLVGGRQPRFGDQRRFWTACVVVAAAAFLYGVGSWFLGWMTRLDKTGEIVNQRRVVRAAAPAAPGKLIPNRRSAREEARQKMLDTIRRLESGGEQKQAIRPIL
jgi:hypothetical protein